MLPQTWHPAFVRRASDTVAGLCEACYKQRSLGACEDEVEQDSNTLLILLL